MAAGQDEAVRALLRPPSGKHDARTCPDTPALLLLDDDLDSRRQQALQDFFSAGLRQPRDGAATHEGSNHGCESDQAQALEHGSHLLLPDDTPFENPGQPLRARRVRETACSRTVPERRPPQERSSPQESTAICALEKRGDRDTGKTQEVVTEPPSPGRGITRAARGPRRGKSYTAVGRFYSCWANAPALRQRYSITDRLARRLPPTAAAAGSHESTNGGAAANA